MHYKYIIFNTKSDAVLLNKTVSDICITGKHWTDKGKTNNYCNIIQHPTENKWAVIILNGYKKYFSPLENENAVELTEDWKPK